MHYEEPNLELDMDHNNDSTEKDSFEYVDSYFGKLKIDTTHIKKPDERAFQEEKDKERDRYVDVFFLLFLVLISAVFLVVSVLLNNIMNDIIFICEELQMMKDALLVQSNVLER